MKKIGKPFILSFVPVHTKTSVHVTVFDMHKTHTHCPSHKLTNNDVHSQSFLSLNLYQRKRLWLYLGKGPFHLIFFLPGWPHKLFIFIYSQCLCGCAWMWSNVFYVCKSFRSQTEAEGGGERQFNENILCWESCRAFSGAYSWSLKARHDSSN